MVSKWQKYLALGVIGLVAIMIVVKLIVNFQSNKIVWEDSDNEVLTSDCLDDLGGYAVRFPSASEEYCSCTADAIMDEYTKFEYYQILENGDQEQNDEMLGVISRCYNAFQQAMFDESKLD